MQEWIAEHASGTLQRAVQEGLSYKNMYLSERTAFEFGYGFELVYNSRLTRGQILAECNTPAITETLWFTRVLRHRLRPIKVTSHYFILTEENQRTEGVGIMLSGLNLPDWIPEGKVPIAFVSIIENGKYSKPVNPC